MSDSAKPSSAEATQETDGAYGDLDRSLLPEGMHVSDATDFDATLKKFSLGDVPEFAFLPRNFHTALDIQHLVYEREARDLQVLARQAGLDLKPVAGSSFQTIHENDASVHLPTIVFLWQLLDNADKVINVADFLAKVAAFTRRHSDVANEEVEVSQEYIVTGKSKTKRFTFRGPASALPDILPILIRESRENDE
jgi:hypothetical protein